MRILERFGWNVERVKGSHHIMRHADHPGTTISVPVYGNRTLPVGTQLDILRDAGIAIDEFNREV